MNRLLAISDIHGCYDTFHELVVNRLKLKKSDRLMLLGDYIDRGEKSKEVIEFIIDLKLKGFEVTALAGNHEWMLTETLKRAEMGRLWMMNDGLSTLNSFEAEDAKQLDNRYTDFLLSLPYYARVGKYIFVHAGLNDDSDDPFADIQSLIWESRLEYSNPILAGKIIIHGHRPKTREYVKNIIMSGSPVIPIDTGCIYDKTSGYGYLSALEVNSMTLISVERI
jgi:serine/threonine protein phosphatase 1